MREMLLTRAQLNCLRIAAQNKGWYLIGPHERATTSAQLEQLGLFETAEHEVYGQTYRLTEAGHEALNEAALAAQPRDWNRYDL